LIGVYVKELDGKWFGVACDDKNVYATTFASTEKAAFDNLFACLPNCLKFEKKDSPPEFADHIIGLIKDVYDGRDVAEKVSFYTKHLPTFTKRTIMATYSIPVGYATSYGAIAKAVGGGARAVGNAMAKNPFCPLVPCHRVVCSDFGLGGYGGSRRRSGLSAKLAFLKREKRGYSREKEIAVEGGKLRVFPVESVLEKTPKHT
jgi:methylated-DNA-[protein]-cysteine S-methyltransferase